MTLKEAIHADYDSLISQLYEWGLCSYHNFEIYKHYDAATFFKMAHWYKRTDEETEKPYKKFLYGVLADAKNISELEINETNKDLLQCKQHYPTLLFIGSQFEQFYKKWQFTLSSQFVEKEWSNTAKQNP